MRTGFTVKWETKTRHGSFESESIKEVEEKRRKLKKKGYKVSEIKQCIF